MAMEVNRFDVFLVSLDPTLGHEIKKTRPCAIVSPDEMNHHIGTVIMDKKESSNQGIQPTK